MTPEILQRETVHQGYLTIERLRLRLSDGGEASREVERHGEAAVVLTSGPIRAHVRAIVERVRPATSVLAQAEIFPRARIRTVGTI